MSKYAKSIVAAVSFVLTALAAVVVDPKLAAIIGAALALVSTVGVYLVPNAPATPAPPTGQTVTANVPSL